VLLSTYGSRGDVEPLVGLAVRLRELGAEVRVCAPPDEEFAARLAGVGVPLVPVGQSARALTIAAPPPSSLPRRAAEVIASQFDAVTAAAEGCDALVATGVMPAAAGALSVAEKLGIRSVSVTFQQLTLPSPHHPPLAYPGRPFPPEVTDNRVLWDLDAQSINALFGDALNTNRASIGLPPVDNVRDYVIGDQPWLATDPTLDPWQETPDLDVVQTGAWILPDVRPLPDDLEAFLDAGTPPVYVGFGSMPMHASTDVAQVAIEAIRAQGRRALVRRGWADLALIDDRDDCFVVGEVNQQALGTSRTGPAGWPTWASARHTTTRLRPPSPCQPRSGPL
jgi:vancomycin aglycone glucosyltransferase